MGRSPDFIIVGFPKCGTHALLRNLGDHPDVFTHPDEVDFFGRDRMSLDDYRALFDTQKQLAGEKTATYVLQPDAMLKMRRLLPDARIIVCVRHPIHMLHSFYNFRVWEYQNNWASGFDGTVYPLHDIVLRDLEVKSFGVGAADFWKHISGNLLSVYPRENCFFAIQERFWDNPQEAYDGVHEFLGVPMRPIERKVINSSVAGADRYPLVDYQHPEYRLALAKMIRYFEQPNAALFELLGEEIPEWRRYDELYAELLSS